MSPRRVARVTLACGECGSTFERLPCQLTRGRGRYCSRACKDRPMRRASTVYCALCDTPFLKRLCEQDSEKNFCSRPCYMEWRAINRGDTYPKAGQVHVHRLVAARGLGRALRPGEVVHHIDEDKTNYDPDNLAVFPSQSHHARCHQGNMSAEELASYSLRSGATAHAS